MNKVLSSVCLCRFLSVYLSKLWASSFIATLLSEIGIQSYAYGVYVYVCLLFLLCSPFKTWVVAEQTTKFKSELNRDSRSCAMSL